jgi:hypothetical protein
MCRNEELPIEPSKRWQAATAKTALYNEKEARKERSTNTRERSSTGSFSQYYVYCADPEAALEIAHRKPRITHSVMAVYDRAQTLKTFQYSVVALSLVVTAVSSIFQDTVKENLKRILLSGEPSPVVKPLDEEAPISLHLRLKSEATQGDITTTAKQPFAPFSASKKFDNPLR